MATRAIGPVQIGSATVGYIRPHPQGGFKFISHSAGHGSSRKGHPTPDAAIPDWVKRLEKKAAERAQ